MATGDDLADLKNVMKEFGADLRRIFTSRDEQRDLLLIELYFEKMSAENIMQKLIKKVVPYASIIADRNSDFFINHDTLFQSLPKFRSRHYKEFWTGTSSDKVLSDENKNAIWAYFDTIVEIVKGFKKVN